MIFPQAERVKYGKNPLAEVVIQFSFKKRLQESDGFTTDTLSNFHQQILKKYPFFIPQDQQMFSLELDAQMVTQNTLKIYQFVSADSKKKILLTSDWIAFSTAAYRSWEEFRSEFEEIFGLFNNSCAKVEKLKRAALRYRDVIERSKIDPNLVSVSWTELLNEGIAPSMLFSNQLSGNLKSYQSNFIVNLDKNGKLVASLGLIANAQTNEPAFLIDGDFFTEEELDYADSIDAIDYFNVEARNFFKWCIKPTLHESLQPVPYSSADSALL